MLLKRFYDDSLAQASYLIGCQATAEAIIVDATRDVGQYAAAAAAEGLQVSYVSETHIHADFVSGSRELASAVGTQLLLSGEGGTDWQYGFAREDGATLLRDGDTFRVGNIEFATLHTPGHSPEHLSFLVTDTGTSSQPLGLLSGDFVFVGDVGRPDLLEKAAHLRGTMDGAARSLFASIHRLRELPDYLQIWPGHGAGSACGKALGAVPQTTLGYERIANWAFGVEHEDEFVTQVLASQPDPPKYFAEMKRINRDGPPILGSLPTPRRLHWSDLERFLKQDDLVVDTRSFQAFAAGHIPKTINIPATRSFTTWAGWLIPYRGEFSLILPQDADPDIIVRQLRMIGLDRVAGFFTEEVLEAWQENGRSLETTDQWRPSDLRKAVDRGEVRIVDVRWQDEWDRGHIPGATHIPLGHLLDRLDDLPDDRPIAVHCQGGGRSAIAASLLKARGIDQLANVVGGFGEWEREGHPIERADGVRAAG